VAQHFGILGAAAPVGFWVAAALLGSWVAQHFAILGGAALRDFGWRSALALQIDAHSDFGL
jgi:hypothetical protein